jgi:hypothetical protein
MQNRESGKTAQPRPKVFRALGKADPPEQVEIDGHPYRRVDILKHDSWAATALYQGSRVMVIAKFNRQQSVFGLPMKWLGRWLAQRETRMLQMLADLPNVPDYSGNLAINGINQLHAVTHDYVPGHPLERREPVNDAFFPTLQQLIKDMHARDLAYVDLSKRQNIIVGDDDKPYLIDRTWTTTMCSNTTETAGPICSALNSSIWRDTGHGLSGWADASASRCVRFAANFWCSLACAQARAGPNPKRPPKTLCDVR